MNPGNLPTSRSTVINGSTEDYYGPEVADNLFYFLMCLAVNGIFCTTLLGMFVDDPSFRDSRLYGFLFGGFQEESKSGELLLPEESKGGSGKGLLRGIKGLGGKDLDRVDFKSSLCLFGEASLNRKGAFLSLYQRPTQIFGEGTELKTVSLDVVLSMKHF